MRPGKLLQCIKCGGGSFIGKIFHDNHAVRHAQGSALAGESSAYLLDQVLGRSVGYGLFGPTRLSSDGAFVPHRLHSHQDGKALILLTSSDRESYLNWASGPTYGAGLSHPHNRWISFLYVLNMHANFHANRM